MVDPDLAEVEVFLACCQSAGAAVVLASGLAGAADSFVGLVDHLASADWD